MKCLDLREKILCFLIILILFSVLSGFLVEKKAAFAQQEELRNVAEVAFGSKNLETNPATIVGRIIEIILGLMGIILVVLMVVAGFMWMTSGGNAEQVTKAKKLMSSALIGLIIIIFSYSLARFAIKKLSTVTEIVPVEEPAE